MWEEVVKGGSSGSMYRAAVTHRCSGGCMSGGWGHMGGRGEGVSGV